MNILLNKLTKSIVAACLSLSLGTSISTPSFGQETPPVLKPIFLDSCSADQRKVALKAHANFAKMLDLALDGVTEETNSVEYLESFGKSDDMSRDFVILGRILLLRIGAATLSMQVSCGSKSDPNCKRPIAYVPPQKRTAKRYEHEIVLCPKFFNATPAWVKKNTGWSKVSEFQAGTLMHEHAHLSWATKELLTKVGMPPDPKTIDQARARDVEYDLEGVKYLAENEPEETILNADSYHIFVMRLAIRKGKIFK